LWPFTVTDATTRDALSLWRETNGLLRELIEVIGQRPSTTPRVPLRSTSATGATSKTTPTSRKLSSTDVSYSTREQLAEIDRKARAKKAAPWREGETTPPPEPEIDSPIESPIESLIRDMNRVTMAETAGLVAEAISGGRAIMPTLPLSVPISYRSAESPADPPAGSQNNPPTTPARSAAGASS
jgi:hypothetical protein